MTELEKCMAGEDYNCHDKIFLDFKSHARKLLQEYNALAYEQKEEKEKILKELCGKTGTKVSVASPFICDYGRNIFMGNNVSVNMNCTFVDCNEIIIGDNVLIASNVQLYTATHPAPLAERYVQNPETGQLVRHTYALPIKIGNGCWLGELIAFLKKKNITVALITGKGEKSCTITLEKLGLSEICYIGDTVQDIKDCQEAGVICFSAAWQESSNADILEKENPDHVFYCVNDLYEYFNRK